MARFNFTNITLSSRANITDVMNNFNILEQNGITYAEVIAIRDALNALISRNATNIQTNTNNINTANTNIAGKAPTNHASTATTYGVGTTTNYGHCKVIDGLTQSAFANGEALSAYQGKLLNDKITTANTNISTNATNIAGKAPTNHASSNTTYGVGTASNYGHCRVINNVTTSSHTDGVALSAYQGKLLNDAINTANTNISGKAPTSHASSATTYGIGTSANYGHCKVVNNVTTSSHSDGVALSAYQGKVLQDNITSLNNSLGGMAKRTYSYGTSAPSGGSNGDVYDQYFT